jgi:hypothetical protein
MEGSMTDPNLLVAASSVSVVAILTFGALRGWRGWLALKRAELQVSAETGSRLEIARLKRRIRKLEATAFTGCG